MCADFLGWVLHRFSPPQIAPLYKMLLLCVENYSFQLNPSLHVFRYHLCASNDVQIQNNLKGSIQYTLLPGSILLMLVFSNLIPCGLATSRLVQKSQYLMRPYCLRCDLVSRYP